MSLFRFGEFTFDLGSRMLLKGGVRTHMSPKAQKLLHLLLAARPRAVSRQDLFDALWPSTFVAESNLATIVKELRRVLDDDSRTPRFIRTVHTFGYAFAAEAIEERSVASAGGVAARVVLEGQTFVLTEGDHLVGRDAEARIVLADKTVSRHHARITIAGRKIVVQDLGSTNGTFIDGRGLTAAYVVNRHSRIEVGAVAGTIAPQSISGTLSMRLDISEIKRQIAH